MFLSIFEVQQPFATWLQDGNKVYGQLTGAFVYNSHRLAFCTHGK